MGKIPLEEIIHIVIDAKTLSCKIEFAGDDEISNIVRGTVLVWDYIPIGKEKLLSDCCGKTFYLLVEE